MLSGGKVATFREIGNEDETQGEGATFRKVVSQDVIRGYCKVATFREI